MKAISILISIFLVISFTACGNASSGQPFTEASSNVTSTLHVADEVNNKDADTIIISDIQPQENEEDEYKPNTIPAVPHNGVETNNIVTPILKELSAMPEESLYLFMKDGAVYSKAQSASEEILVKPYSLGNINGFLSAVFLGPVDTTVTADNVTNVTTIGYYYRGITESQFNQILGDFEQYGIEHWYIDESPDWNNLSTDKDYAWSGFFTYEDKLHEISIVLVTSQERSEYIDAELEEVLGIEWPQLTFQLYCIE